jgi:signal transduction histidine kinase
MLGPEPGGLLVVSRTSDRAFVPAEIGVIELIGNAAMLALRNAELLEDLKAANTAKSEFLNLAAHELRTPVTVIKGYTSMLQAGSLDEGAEREHALSTIENKTAELARLVDSLLFTARLQAQPPAADDRSFDAVDVSARAVERAGAYARLGGASVTWSTDVEHLDALGDPESAGRILDNLLNNAIAYSDGPAHVELRITSTAEEVAIEVEDKGRGIPADQQAAVFDAFVRVEEPGSDPGTGAGLGLYIARRLAENIGAELSLVRSAPGSGSVFRLRLRRRVEAGR